MLWSGSFTSGSITVPGLSNYTIILVNVGDCPCIGTKDYGGMLIPDYGSNSLISYGYRFTVDGNTLTINDINKGGTNGTQLCPVLQILGLL